MYPSEGIRTFRRYCLGGGGYGLGVSFWWFCAVVPSYFSVFAGTNKPTPPPGAISAAFTMDDKTVSLATLKMKTFESGGE